MLRSGFEDLGEREKLEILDREGSYLCPKCNLSYHLDRGEVIGPMIPLSGTSEKQTEGKEVEKPAHARLSKEEFEEFLKYLDAEGPGRKAYKTSGRGGREGMIESWIKMGKPTVEKREIPKK